MIFDSLDKEAIYKIIEIELQHLYGRVNELGYKIKISTKAKDYIIENGWDEQFGARPLKRAIQKYIEDPLAEEIIKTSIHEGDTISIGHDAKNDSISIKIIKKKKELKKS